MAKDVIQEVQLQMAVVPQDWLEEVTEKLETVKTLLEKKSVEERNAEWIDSVEARRMLGVSQKTWQTYRDQRRIPFSQHGRKIYVKRADLEAFMEAHYIGAKNK